MDDKCGRASSLIASLRLGLGTDWWGLGLVASPLAGQADRLDHPAKQGTVIPHAPCTDRMQLDICLYVPRPLVDSVSRQSVSQSVSHEDISSNCRAQPSTHVYLVLQQCLCRWSPFTPASHIRSGRGLQLGAYLGRKGLAGRITNRIHTYQPSLLPSSPSISIPSDPRVSVGGLATCQRLVCSLQSIVYIQFMPSRASTLLGLSPELMVCSCCTCQMSVT